MKRKLICIFTVLLLLTMIMSGCAKKEEASGTGGDGKGTEAAQTGNTAAGDEVQVNEDGTVNNPESVKIKEGYLAFWSLFSGGDGEFMDSIVSSYNATNPTMPVQSVMLVWADYYTKLQTAVAANRGPDIGISHASKLPELVEQGVVIPIDEYANQVGVDWNQFTASTIESISFDGSKYAMPLDTHAEIIYFNKDILKQANVSLNANEQLDISSVDDFYSILDKVKAIVPDGTSPLSLPQSGDDPYRVWWATYFQMGGTPLVNNEGTKVTMDKGIAVKAAEFIKGLFDKGYVNPGIDDHQKLFQNGKAGLLIGGTWATGVFEKTENLNFGAQAFPKLFNKDACWADAHTFIIPSNKGRTDAETKASVEFINYVSSKGALTWAKSGQIPSNLSVIDSKDYLSMPYRSSYKGALQTAVLPSKNPNFYSMKDAMITNLNTIWLGQVAAAEAIDNLYGELEACLD